MRGRYQIIAAAAIVIILLATTAAHAKSNQTEALSDTKTEATYSHITSTNSSLQYDLLPENINGSMKTDVKRYKIGLPIKAPSTISTIHSTASNLAQVGAALITNFVLHELGHKTLGDSVGATSSNIDFLKKHDGQFLLGISSVEQIDSESMLPYSLAGEVASDLTFEHALMNYRKKPTQFNRSLMIMSGTDFLRYCIYAFYIADDDNSAYDPVAISNASGISRDTIFAVALTKTMINAYRVYSGNDTVVPYFSVNKNTAMLKFKIAF